MGHHVSLNVGDVVVQGAIVEPGHGHAVGVVHELQGVVAHGHLPKLAAVVNVAVGFTSVTAAGPHSVGVVGVGPGAIGERIANPIVGNGMAVIGGQQVPPIAVPIAVGMAFHSEGGTPPPGAWLS